MKRIATILIAACAGAAGATGLESLEQFLRSVHRGRAQFSQVVTAPARAGEAARSKTSSGTFEFARPGQFRFEYRKPFAQSIVADGQTLWLFDADLNQVTARKQAQALASTPAAVIATAADLRALQADFVLADAPDQDGLQWVQATPRTPDTQLQSVRVGFAQGAPVGKSPVLAVLEIQDSFGQRSVLRFSALEINPVLAAQHFQFVPPPGADVVRQ